MAVTSEVNHLVQIVGNKIMGMLTEVIISHYSMWPYISWMTNY